jgi:hypothetical protein
MPLMTSPRPARRARGTLSGFALIVAAAGCSVLLAQAPAGVEGPATEGVGLLRNDPGAYRGYTLLSPLSSRTTFLIDMEGRVVNAWVTDSTPSSLAYLLPHGNLLRAGVWAEAPIRGVAGGGGRLQELTWDGKPVWDFTYGTTTRIPHHDFTRLPNGNILLVVQDRRSADEALAAGRIASTIQGGEVHADSLIEIRPTGPTTADVVWEWHAWDHLIQDHDRTKANFGDVAVHPERIDVNFNVVPDRRANPDWTHFNAVAYNARLDQIVVSLRNFSEIWIIDHSTTTKEAAGTTGGRSGRGGDLLFRWGNPRAYRAGTAADQRLFGQHDAHWIPDGLPGAGHLLLYNNGDTRPDSRYSSVEELVLPMDAAGRYQRLPNGQYGPDAPEWSYTAPNKTDFYSVNISGAMRLPNGNTLICAGAPGILFEVTSAGRVVWQYNVPSFAAGGANTGAGRGAARGTGDGRGGRGDTAATGGAVPPPGAQGPGRAGAAGRGGRGGLGNNAGRNVFRAYRYGPDFPGLAGRTLTSGAPLVSVAP